MNKYTGIQRDVGHRVVLNQANEEQVCPLAATVISLLNDRSDKATRNVGPEIVERVALAMVRDDGDVVDTVLSALLHERLTATQIIGECIPQAVRRLGSLWFEDRLSFAEVTIGSARLQGLLGSFSPDWTDWNLRAPLPPDVVLIIPENDDHTVGLHVAATQLRRAGASVRLLFAPTAGQTVQALRNDPTNVLMISSSRLQDLAKLADFVSHIRRNLDPVPPVAIGGVVVNLADDIADQTGADLATDDVLAALALGCVTESSGGYAGHGPPQHYAIGADVEIASGRNG